jgi:4a-hydroxytetrahydrobiopterin dehydratase
MSIAGIVGRSGARRQAGSSQLGSPFDPLTARPERATSSVMALADQRCVPCRGGVPPLGPERIAELLRELEPGWESVRDHHLRKTYKLKDFKSALELVNRIGAMAEEQGHHPDLLLAWGKVVVEVWTHKIGGLTESDFVFAAKCDRLFAA